MTIAIFVFLQGGLAVLTIWSWRGEVHRSLGWRLGHSAILFALLSCGVLLLALFSMTERIRVISLLVDTGSGIVLFLFNQEAVVAFFGRVPTQEGKTPREFEQDSERVHNGEE